MSLSVICAGYARTGTTSLGLALRVLGFGPCYLFPIHGIATPESCAFWQRALDHESVDWDEVFGSFSVTAALIGCLFYRELATKYPSAKIILTVREQDTWFESTSAMLSSEALAALKELPSWPVFSKALAAAYGKIGNRDSVIALYDRHNDDVQKAVPADRLLVYRVRDGWVPLCKFLGIPTIPEMPFPNVCERDMWSGDLSHYRALYARMHAGATGRTSRLL